MSFWEQNQHLAPAKSTAVEKTKPIKEYPSALNNLTGECSICGALSDDIMFGICGACA